MNEILLWDLPCIIDLNARSLNTEKNDELQVIASNFNVSIICVTETWLKDYIVFLLCKERRIVYTNCLIGG